MRVVSLVGLALVLSSPAYSQEQVLELGKLYPAGTRVSSPPTGVSFVIPNEFSGQYDAEAKTFCYDEAGTAQSGDWCLRHLGG